MRRRRITREPEVDPFYDMLFNMLIAFVFCFIVALLAMNPKALKAGDIPSKAEFIVNVAWPDGNAGAQGRRGDRLPLHRAARWQRHRHQHAGQDAGATS